MGRAFAHFLVFIFIAVGQSAAAGDTSGTLTLGAIFDLESAAAPSPTPQRSTTLAAVRVPDTSLWRRPTPTPEVPPTPTPSPSPTEVPLPEGVDLSKITNRIRNSRSSPKEMSTEGLDYRGRTSEGVPRNHALISLETNFLQLRTEYRIEWLDDDAPRQDLVVFHAPQTSEQFSVPVGRVRLVRRLWLYESPAKVLTQEFKPLSLRSGNLYRFEAEVVDEQALISSLMR